MFTHSCEFKKYKKINLKINMNLKILKIGFHMIKKYRLSSHMKIENTLK